MSWSIGLLENTVKLSKKGFKALAGTKTMVYDYEHSYASFSVGENRITFSEDDREYMDWMCHQDVQEVLKEHKASGRALFGSLEGDNDGLFWGYDFDGEGGMKELKGTLVWE